MNWTDEHGPDQLYEKFTVIRNRTGEKLPAGEFVFVLRPESDQAAVTALFEYADAVEVRSPQLAREIREKLDEIVQRNREGGDE